MIKPETLTPRELTDQNIDAFLYQLYNRILTFATQGYSMRRALSFKPQRVDHWQEIEGREGRPVSVSFHIEGAVLFVGDNINFAVVLGRGANGLARTPKPLRVLFGGFGFDLVKRRADMGEEVDVEDLKGMTVGLGKGHIIGEFYNDDRERLGINCWADKTRFGGRGLQRDIALSTNPQSFLSEYGTQLCLNIVQQTIRQGKNR